MEKVITIRPENKKALALLEKLHDKKQKIKKQMQSSAIAAKIRAKSK